MTRLRFLLALAALVPLAFSVPSAQAASKPEIFATDGVAIHGYDPVAYFTQGKPVKGSPDHSLTWKGATWYFASAANRDAFKADPAKYAPQYGGYCAYAVSNGYTAPISPDAWTVQDGKLYLNFNKDVQSRWEKNRAERIRDADANWPGVLTK